MITLLSLRTTMDLHLNLFTPTHYNYVNSMKKRDRKIYIDDLTELEVVPLKTTLVRMEPLCGPLNFHETYGLVLPPSKSILQHKLADIQRFT